MVAGKSKVREKIHDIPKTIKQNMKTGDYKKPDRSITVDTGLHWR